MATGRVPTTANSPLTAKGDLFTYSTAPARLAVGTNGDSLVADSSTATGLRYNPSYTAGKNFVINGNMDIWQRGTTVSFGSFDARYLADRWALFVATANNTLSQETTTVPTGAQYALKWTSTGAGGSYGMYQVIETANTIPLAGKTVTLSASVTGTTGKTAYIQIATSTGVDTLVTGSWTAAGNSSIATLTSGTFSKLTITTTLNASVKTIRVAVISSDSFANTEYITFGSAQLEVGSVATQFSRAGGTIQGELAACQRYYYRQTGTDTNTVLSNAGWGSNNAQYVYGIVTNPVTMRTTPTVLDYANIRFGDGTNFAPPTTLTIATSQGGASPTNIQIYYSPGGQTQYRPYWISCNSNSAGYIGLGAEL